MYEQVEKPKENKSRAVDNNVGQKKSNEQQSFGLVDNRPILKSQMGTIPGQERECFLTNLVRPNQ